jgi:DNA modification methylase
MEEKMDAHVRPSRTLAPASGKLAIAQVKICNLKPCAGNPRVHSNKQISQIANSIRVFGFLVPIVIDQQLNVIAGHGRVLACKQLGMKEVPAICLNHLTPDQVRAFMIADNKLTENADWDRQLLAEQFKFLSDEKLDFALLEVTAFEMAEIDLTIEDAAPVNEGQNDPADKLPDPTECAASQPGDLWLLGRHRVFCGNALLASSYSCLMAGRKANLVISDAPYNVKIQGHASGLGSVRHRNFRMAAGEMTEGEFTDFLAQAFTLMAQYSEAGSLHYVFMDWRHIREMLSASRHIYSELKNLCIWVKDNGGMGSLYRSQHELVFVFKNGVEPHSNNVQLGKFGRYRTNVWNYPGANSFSRSSVEGNLLGWHPTPKPVALIADAILDCSKRGDIVLDPFLGSGTTVIAAERSGRVCYGIELDPVYIDTTIRRWQKFTGLLARHAASGRTFAELEQEASNGTK